MDRCNTDRGRALKRIHRNAGEDRAFLEFIDGKFYEVRPVFEADLFHLAQPDTMPGCWFNKTLRRRKRYVFRRLDSWPVSMISVGISVDFTGPLSERRVTGLQ